MKNKAVKKPIEIDYFKYNGVKRELKEWIESFGDSFENVIINEPMGSILVNTLEGSSYAVPSGYIIIRGIKGEYYPCEPKIFKDTYELIS